MLNVLKNDGRKISYHIISRLGAAGVQKGRFFTQPVATRRAKFWIFWSFWIIDGEGNQMGATYMIRDL